MDHREFARSIIHGTGGLLCFDRCEAADLASDPVEVAAWTLRCLANPHCEGSEVALAAILERRRELTLEATATEAAKGVKVAV